MPIISDDSSMSQGRLRGGPVGSKAGVALCVDASGEFAPFGTHGSLSSGNILHVYAGCGNADGVVINHVCSVQLVQLAAGQATIFKGDALSADRLTPGSWRKSDPTLAQLTDAIMVALEDSAQTLPATTRFVRALQVSSSGLVIQEPG